MFSKCLPYYLDNTNHILSNLYTRREEAWREPGVGMELVDSLISVAFGPGPRGASLLAQMLLKPQHIDGKGRIGTSFWRGYHTTHDSYMK